MAIWKSLLIFTVVCNAGLLSLRTSANSDIDIPHAQEPFKIDGVMNEGIWKKAKKVYLNVQTHPKENVEPSVKTEAFLVEDGKHLILGFKAYDPEPETIRAFLRDRDSAYSDDFIGVVLDTFNDEKRAFEFFSNPLGAQMDLINDDVARREDDSWNATWEANGQINSEGYIVEMAIPLNILRFKPGLDYQTWGIELIRFRPRKDRERISNTALDRNIACYLCKLPKAKGFKNAQPAKNIEIVPAIVTSQSKSRDLGETTEWESNETIEPSLDLRWGITAASTLNFTINPDFSQVEADAAQLNVNRTFALHFREKRPFFLDSADYFKSYENIVHTRNIVEPRAGIKLTNKSEKNTSGFILADDKETNVLLPRHDGSEVKTLETESQNAIARYRRNFGKRSTIGVVSTFRQADDYQNTVFGIDSKHFFSDQDSIQAQLLTTRSNNPDELRVNDDGEYVLAEEQSGSGGRIRYEHSGRNWYWQAEHKQYDKDFRADLGFISKVDYDFQKLAAAYTWHADESSWWNRAKIYADWDITHRSDGQLLEKEFEAFAMLKGPMQSYLEVFGLVRDKFHEDTLYEQTLYGVYGEFKPKAGVYFSLLAEKADAIDYDNNDEGELSLLKPELRWNINRHIEMRTDLRFEDFNRDEGKLFEASSANLRLTYQFSNRSFLRYSAQRVKVKRNLSLYNTPSDFKALEVTTNQQLLYSYKITPQTIFFLGYSEAGLKNDDYLSYTANDRTIFMKMSYAWLPN